MQRPGRTFRIIAASVILIAIPASASNRAIAEDPEFCAAWAAYKASHAEARTPQQPLHEFPFAAVAEPKSNGPRPPVTAWVALNVTATTPQAICEAVSSRIRYAADTTDHWQDSLETWNRRLGDCEDFAATVRDICLARGLDASIYILNAKNKNEAHAIVIGRHNGTVWMSSNGQYQDVRDIKHAQDIVMREQDWNHSDIAVYLADKNMLSSVQPASPSHVVGNNR